MTLQTPESGADTGLYDTFMQSLENLSNDALKVTYLMDMVREIHDTKQLHTMVDLCADLARSLANKANEVVHLAIRAENSKAGTM